MNDDRQGSDDGLTAARVRQIQRAIETFERQISPDIDGARAELVAALRRILAGAATPADSEVIEAVKLLDDWSGLDEDVESVPSRVVASYAVAAVLDRRDAAFLPQGPDSSWAPVAEWKDKLQRLCRTSTRALPEVAEELARRGVHEPPHTVLERLPFDDEEQARAVVEAFGERWIDDGYRFLYRTLRQTVVPPAPIANRRVTGLASVAAVDVLAATAQVAAPIHDMPTVRGRQRLINRLTDGLAGTRPLVSVLVGDAGYGKSTIALAVARRADANGIAPLWVSASDLDALVEGLRLVAVRLGATTADVDAAWGVRPAERVKRFWALLDASPERWLLVLDDAGPRAVGDSRWVHRSPAGAVLITSRHGDRTGWGPDAETIRVGRLEPAYGARVVLDCIQAAGSQVRPAMEQPARELSTRLAGMPLALVNVANLAASRENRSASASGDSSNSDIRALTELVEELTARPAGNPVGRTYEICLRAVSTHPPYAARYLLRLLACFAPDEPLPVTVLDGAISPPEDAGGSRWRAVLAELASVGLVEELPDGRHGKRCLRIHPAVAEQSGEDQTFGAVGVRRLDGLAMQMLRAELDGLDPGVPANWPLLRRLEPHVSKMIDNPALAGRDMLAIALSMADRMAVALMRAGHHSKAHVLLETALSKTRALGSEHPAQLDARHTQAWMMAVSGELVHAQELLQGLLVDKERLLGKEDRSTLKTADCLAWTLAEQNDLFPAYEQFKQIAKEREWLLGPDHPETLATRHRLAWVTCLRGGIVEGADELATVLELRRKKLGSDHLDVYSTRYRLAWALNKKGQHAEAERQYQRLETDLEDAVGRNNPLTLIVRSRRTMMLVWLNRFAEAESQYIELLADQRKVLGDKHPRTLRTRFQLATLNLQLGRVKPAVRELQAVTEGRGELLGADHIDTLTTRVCLAWAHVQAGHVNRAESELRSVLADQQRVLGPYHPATLKTSIRWSRTLIQAGRLIEARDELRHLLSEQMVLMGPYHRQLLDTRHALAYVTGLLGDYGSCESELRAVLAERVRLIGPEHVETLTTRDYLVWTLGSAGHIEAARQECQELLAERLRLLGPTHPHTLTSRYRLAWLDGRGGEHDRSLAAFEQLLTDLREVLGEYHHATFRCRGAIVRALRLSGRIDAAEAAALELIRLENELGIVQSRENVSAREELALLRRFDDEAGESGRGRADL
ncbi:MAG: tetratricopeptide repeat protein [Pseudonocardia sp.]|nr:tetratricopeptide repeat protein [Pseudonocardia sp.]